jgi:hypothetical protein
VERVWRQAAKQILLPHVQQVQAPYKNAELAIAQYRASRENAGERATVPDDAEAAAKHWCEVAAATMAEALLVKRIQGPPDSVVAEVRKHITNMAKMGISTDHIQPALWRKAQELLRA